MRLSAEERAIMAGRRGEAPRRALDLQVRVGDFFGAPNLVPVGSVHMMGDAEALGEAGIRFVEEMAAAGARAVVPAVNDPRSVDFACARELGQSEEIVARERRIVAALAEMGFVIGNTCIPYQTLFQPRFGEHLAWGDTGSVIFANSVAGARSNFEGGPVALAAALTGRTPAYGFHQPRQRRATVVVEVRDRPRELADWGALGAYVGRRVSDYWQVPVLLGDLDPSIDALKHLGAALASYGSLAMFHLLGVTPEARTLREATGGRRLRRVRVPVGAIEQTYGGFRPERETVDLVVFTAPQLSLLEIREIADGLAGRRVHPGTQVWLTTNAQMKALADAHGYTRRLEEAGARIITGTCFYIMTAGELARKFGYRVLVTNSAKLANIISGYGYNPVLRRTAVCLEAAVTGRIA